MPINTFFIQKYCDRCHRELGEKRVLSFFTREALCMNCSTKEDEVRRNIREQDGEPMADLKYQGIGVIPAVKSYRSH